LFFHAFLTTAGKNLTADRKFDFYLTLSGLLTNATGGPGGERG